MSQENIRTFRPRTEGNAEFVTTADATILTSPEGLGHEVVEVLVPVLNWRGVQIQASLGRYPLEEAVTFAKQYNGGEIEVYDSLREEIYRSNYRKAKSSFDDFTRGYLSAAIRFTEGYLTNTPKYSISDIPQGDISEIVKECLDFQVRFSDLYERYFEPSAAGRLFFLTRNLYSHGFYNADIPQPLRNLLSEFCQEAGESRLRVCDKGPLLSFRKGKS